MRNSSVRPQLPSTGADVAVGRGSRCRGLDRLNDVLTPHVAVVLVVQEGVGALVDDRIDRRGLYAAVGVGADGVFDDVGFPVMNSAFLM